MGRSRTHRVMVHITGAAGPYSEPVSSSLKEGERHGAAWNEGYADREPAKPGSTSGLVREKSSQRPRWLVRVLARDLSDGGTSEAVPAVELDQHD